MLTESELAWLDARRVEPFSFCNHCWIQLAPHCAGSPQCPLTTLGIELYAAIEFEQRVAAKLAELFSASTEIAPLCPSCPCEDDCYDGKLKCKAAILKYARLEIEKEMENDQK